MVQIEAKTGAVKLFCQGASMAPLELCLGLLTAAFFFFFFWTMPCRDANRGKRLCPPHGLAATTLRSMSTRNWSVIP